MDESSKEANKIDAATFRRMGYDIVDYIADYRESLLRRDTKPVSCKVQPGYMIERLGRKPPLNPVNIETYLSQILDLITPGLVHWHHPSFFGYFPCGASYPSILGNLLADGFGVLGFKWDTSPACTELETVVMTWLGEALNLPSCFLASDGFGMLVGSASEACLVALTSARDRYKRRHCPNIDNQRLVLYASEICHGSVRKVAHILGVRVNLVEVNGEDDNPRRRFGMRRDQVRIAIEGDINEGLVPFSICCTLGTTDVCSFDQLSEMTLLAKQHDMWIHVDAAYAGAALICPELRHLVEEGLNCADSIAVTTSKWMLVNHEGCALWCTDRLAVEQSMIQDLPYLRSTTLTHQFSNGSVEANDVQAHCTDFSFMSLQTGRHFRALKHMFVLQCYGVSGIQRHVRNHVNLAKHMACHIRDHPLLSLFCEPCLGLVCFQMAVPCSDECTDQLLRALNHTRRLFLVGTSVKGRMVIRLCMCCEQVTKQDVDDSFNLISDLARAQALICKHHQ